jgi:DNA-binding MarR family transcriptional regulator
MITNDEELTELRRLLRLVMRGLWSHRRPTPELLELVSGDPPLGRRHVGLLAQIGTDGERSVGELARELDLSLPAASKLTRDLEEHGLVERREDPEDRRRTVVALSPVTAKRVRAWLDRRSQPLEQALATLDTKEREAFLKGLRALGDALMEESACGSERRHHQKAHRRGAHRDRPV